MAGRLILVDGYNVIGADPVLSRLQRHSLADARSALISRISASPRFLSDSVTVVFDGRRAGTHFTEERHGNVTVVFSSAGASADDVIKARAGAVQHPPQVVVVTNDRDVQDACRLLGCTITGSENLLDQVSRPRGLTQRRFHDDEDAAHREVSKTKKGNARRLPKRLRNVREYRF